MEMMEELVSHLWRSINYCLLWIESIYTSLGMDFRLMLVSMVFLYSGYKFILGPYLKGTGYGFLDYTSNKTYKGGKNR